MKGTERISEFFSSEKVTERALRNKNLVISEKLVAYNNFNFCFMHEF